MAARKAPTKNPKDVRLSAFVTPQKYKIHFEPDLENFTFIGEEEIVLDIKKPTKVLRLHSAEIEVLKSEIVQTKKTTIGKVAYKEKDEEIQIVFDGTIKPGKAILKLSFTGILNDKMRGFYRSKYTHNGRDYHMGVTQFESTDARRAFPSFDEPSQKAVFEVSFRVPSDRTVISNTIESEVLEHQGGYKTVRFSPSPKMSSYLLAFIIGHFEFISKKTKDGTLVRVFVTPGKKKQAEFALTCAVKTLEFYTDYFKIKYPLPTSDLIAIPDFAAGAMENWGAVTYRESAVLVDPVNSSTHNKQWVALVIAHELAHQWFGNLVTMEWWTHLWLNEGFASYIEYLAVNNMFPQWHVWTQFVYMDHGRALELDGLKSTHPIEVEVSHPAEISEIFDEVSYSKGASIIRMLAEYLGEKNFRDGLRTYLKKHSYANAKTEDLWDALAKTSKKPVAKMMANWTGKPGYPVVSVDRTKDSISFSQQRFFSSVFSQKTKDETVWMTPISVISKDSTKTEQLLLDKRSKKLETTSKNWIKVNRNETSFMRVRYSPELLAFLEEPLKKLDKKLSEQDRFAIIRDAFVLSEAGYSETSAALKLATAYKNDESYIVWSEIATEIGKVKALLFGTEVYSEFQGYIVDLFSEIANKVGWDAKKNEDHATAMLRGMVLGVMGRNKDIETIRIALEKFKKDKTGREKLPADLRGVVYSIVADNGGDKEYREFLKLYKETTFEEEKDRILRALCTFKDESLLRKTLELSFSKEARNQDAAKIIAMVWGNPYGRHITWEFVKSNWTQIVKKYGGGHLYNRFVKPAANFTNIADAKDVENFFKTHDSTGLDRTIAQATEQIRSNAEWLKRDYKKIQEFLKIRASH